MAVKAPRQHRSDISCWSVLVMLQDAGINVEVTERPQRQREQVSLMAKCIKNWLGSTVTDSCARSSAQSAYDELCRVLTTQP